MLALSRRFNQSILIGPSKGVTKITVVRLGTVSVRLAFEADDGTEIWREEIAEGKFDGVTDRTEIEPLSVRRSEGDK